MGSSRVQVKCPSCGEIFLPSVEETQSRAGRSSRRKGHAFERTIAKKLQTWWNQNGKFKYEFRRTPQSGGSALKQGWGLAGDIATTAINFPWHLELKNAPGSFAGLHQFISAPKFKFWEWLEQANKDCPQNKKVILIFNRFDQPTWCASNVPWILNRLDYIKASYFIFHCVGKLDVVIWDLDTMLNSNPSVWDEFGPPQEEHHDETKTLQSMPKDAAGH